MGWMFTVFPKVKIHISEYSVKVKMSILTNNFQKKRLIEKSI